MLRPCGRACRRTLTSINLPQTNNPPLNPCGRARPTQRSTLTQTHCNQTYATLFHACARQHFLQQGLSLHHYMLAHNPITPHPDLFVSNHLIIMYAKFGYLDHAHHLFDEMPRRNLVTWTALISEYAQRGRSEACFPLFAAMLVHYLPNEFAFSSVVSSCADSDGGYGRQVHALALKMSLDVANALITMYSKVCDHGGVFVLYRGIPCSYHPSGHQVLLSTALSH
ncbi:putative pentatricopeptide [Rosa chinensis]|uniref:Putative pentatricopeptide n=1 Tax=Rosa chinensis TaxID=74649 RepID=A0A2P6PKP7_ROSCH|nr:putative pentatricopeptide [Rosa chinensis]